MEFLAVNPLAVFSAAIAMFLIASLWYSPFLFVRPWMAIVEKMPNAGADRKKPLLLAALLALVTAYALALIISWAQVQGAVPGALIGFVAALGLVIPPLLRLSLFEHRPITLFRLSAGHLLIEMTVAGVILGEWRLIWP